MIYNTLFLDWDGTSFLGSKINPSLKRIIKSFPSKYIFFVTNNSSKRTDSYYNILQRHGLFNPNITIISSLIIAIWYLKEIMQYSYVYSVASKGVINEIKESGLNNDFKMAEAVLLTYDMTINYKKIQTAYELIDNGKPFYATHNDLLCPDINHNYVDCGTLVELFRITTNIEPIIIGKPSDIACEYITKYYSKNLNNSIYIGDKEETDGSFASKLGLQFLKIEFKI